MTFFGSKKEYEDYPDNETLKKQLRLLSQNRDIDSQRELLQDDILCILDGLVENKILDNICEVIVKRFNKLK